MTGKKQPTQFKRQFDCEGILIDFYQFVINDIPYKPILAKLVQFQ
jgi:hypothetical protein